MHGNPHLIIYYQYQNQIIFETKKRTKTVFPIQQNISMFHGQLYNPLGIQRIEQTKKRKQCNQY